MNKKQIENEKLRLMVFESAKELGEKLDEHLLNMYGINSLCHLYLLDHPMLGLNVTIYY